LATFLHVNDSAGQLDAEHPCQGAAPDLKLVTQPPTQLPVRAASSASWAVIGDADEVGVVGDVEGDAVVRAIACCSALRGPLTGFGALTRRVGSRVPSSFEDAAVCDIAVLLRPHSNSAAAPCTKNNEVFMSAPFWKV